VSSRQRFRGGASRRGRTGASVRAILGAAALAFGAVPGCTPLFLPPVPTDALAPLPSWRVAGDAEVRAVRDGAGGVAWLRLRIRFDEVPMPAWVAVQWFGPTGGERASASRWVTPQEIDRILTWDTPADLDVGPGRWRAVVSVGGRLLRQIDVDVAVHGSP